MFNVHALMPEGHSTAGMQANKSANSEQVMMSLSERGKLSAGSLFNAPSSCCSTY